MPYEPDNKKKTPKGLAPISLYSDSATQIAPDSVSEDYAPFGRLIQCELVITVDSSAIETPIVGSSLMTCGITVA